MKTIKSEIFGDLTTWIDCLSSSINYCLLCSGCFQFRIFSILGCICCLFWLHFCRFSSIITHWCRICFPYIICLCYKSIHFLPIAAFYICCCIHQLSENSHPLDSLNAKCTQNLTDFSVSLIFHHMPIWWNRGKCGKII